MTSRILGVNIGAVNTSREILQDGMLPRTFITHHRTYIVLVDTADIDTDDDVTAATDEHIFSIPGLPALYSALYGKIFLRNRKATEISTVIDPLGGNTAGLWHLDYYWDNELDWSNYVGILSNDPTLSRPQRRWRTEEIEMDLEEDAITGNPIVNPVGERIAISRQESIGVLTLTRYETWPFDESIIAQYIKTTNSETFGVSFPGCVLLSDIETEEVCIESGMYIKATYTIKCRYGDMWPFTDDDEWNAKPLCEGTKHFVDDGNGNKILRVNTDANGNPTSCRLNADGYKLAPEDDPVYLNFARYRQTNWVTDLNLTAS